MEVGKHSSVCCHLIQVRRYKSFSAEHSEIGITLIIGEDYYHVRLVACATADYSE